MATYYRQENVGSLSSIANVLTTHSSKVTSDDSGSSLIINVWDDIVLTFTNKSATDSAAFTINIDGTEVASGSLKIYYGHIAIEMVESDDLLSIKLSPYGFSSIMDKGIYLVEFKEGSDSYAGRYVWEASSNNTLDNHGIEDVIFNAVGGSGNSIYINKLFQYSAYPGTLDYSDYSVLTSSGVRIAITNLFKSCSTVNLKSSVTLNGINYFAIGTNTLIDIEST